MNWGLFYSEAVGWGARQTLPRPLRSPVYRAFARAVGAQLDEVELPLVQYPSFGSFFARRLRADARAVEQRQAVVVSPCDGTVAASGTVHDGRLIQAKGRDYAVADLLADPDLAQAFVGGSFVTIYLSPKDYHRVHVPCGAAVSGYSYVPGSLYPVKSPWVERVPELFARNERLIVELHTQGGRIALVMVGASGVGNMTLVQEGVETRLVRGERQPRRVRHGRPREARIGDELGCFHLGSTVILLFEPERVVLELPPEGSALRFGQTIARMS